MTFKSFFFKSIPVLTVLLFGLISFSRSVYGDEAWLGEFVYWLNTTGKVKSQLFGQMLQYDSQVLVYHKFFTIFSAFVVKVIGFGLLQLRGINFVMIALLAYSTYKYCLNNGFNKNWAIWIVPLILLNPIFVRYGNIFRPEVMTVTLGFISFYFLHTFIKDKSKKRMLVLSAFFAGLSAFSHLNGLIFIGASVVVLAFQKNIKSILIFGSISSAVLLLYFWDIVYFDAFDQFKIQFTQDPAIEHHEKSPLGLLYNLLNEHRRWFHDGSSILGIAVPFLLFLIIGFRKVRESNNVLLTYALVAIVLLGLLSPIKTVKYLICIIPFCSILVLYFFKNVCLNSNKLLQLIMGLILAAAVGVSVFYVSKLELDSKSIKDENTVIAKLLKKDTKVLAPLTFIFDEIDNHEISGLHYYRYFHNRYKKIKEPNSIENVFIDSRQKAIDYVLLDRQNLSPLPIPTTTPTGYTLIFDNARWMVFESKTK